MLNGWPDFEQLVQRMQALRPDTDMDIADKLKVCVLKHNPTRLLLLASLAEKFLSMESDVAEDARQIIQEHNRQFNATESDVDFLYQEQQQHAPERSSWSNRSSDA